MVKHTSRTLGLAWSVPADVLAAMRMLTDRGHRVWIVGGAIRDAFLGLEPKDWDLATTASPEDVIRFFPHVVPTGIRHGTVQVRTSERGIEVSSIDGRDLEAIVRDLTRRDFTVNAMAVSFPEERLLDPHGGLKDLERGLLRGVRDPAARFREDPLRTLRAGRLLSVYGLRLEAGTRRAVAEESIGLTSVAPERIREEVYKLLAGTHAGEGLAAMREGNVWTAVLPEIGEEGVFRHAMEMVHHCPPRPRLRLAALLHAIGRGEDDLDAPSGERSCADAARASRKMADAVLTRWKASHREIRDLGLIVENQLPSTLADWSEGDLCRWLAAAGPNLLDDLIELARAERLAGSRRSGPSAPGETLPEPDELELFHQRVSRLLRRNPPLTIRQLALNGEDVMRLLRLGPGPLVGKLLHRLHDCVLDDPERNTTAALSELLDREYRRLQREGPE